MLVPSGSVALASAPPSSRARVASTAPARTANASAVNSPVASRASRSAPACEQRGDRRRRCSRPPPASTRSARRALGRVDVGAGRDQRLDRRPRRPCARPSSTPSRPRRTRRSRRRRRRAARCIIAASPFSAARYSGAHAVAIRGVDGGAGREQRRARGRGRRGARPNAAPTCRRRRPSFGSRARRATLRSSRAVAVLRGGEQRAALGRDAAAAAPAQQQQRSARAALRTARARARPVLSPSDSSRHADLVEHRQQQVRHRRVARARRGADRRRPPAGPPTSVSGRSICACRFGLLNAAPYKNSEWSSSVPSPSGVAASLLRNPANRSVWYVLSFA